MELLAVASIAASLAVAILVVLVYIRKRAVTAAESDSSDDETSGPLSVNVVADHDEQDSLLPSFSSLLRSPWHNVSTGEKERPKRMQPVRKGSLSLSLTMPLPLRKKRKPTEVPTKKVHVPYFFPLLDETAEWWQTQQSASELQPTSEEEPEQDPDNHIAEHEDADCIETEQLQPGPPHFSGDAIIAAPIEVGAR